MSQSAMEYVSGSTFVCKSIDAVKEVNSFWQSNYLCSYLSSMILFECFVDAIFQILVFLLHFWKNYFLGIYIKAQSLTYFCSIALNNSAKNETMKHTMILPKMQQKSRSIFLLYWNLLQSTKFQIFLLHHPE